MTNTEALRLAEELELMAVNAEYRGEIGNSEPCRSAATLIREQQERIRTLEGENAAKDARIDTDAMRRQRQL
jgi:hypothetical protein